MRSLYIGDAIPNPVFTEFLVIRKEVLKNPKLYNGKYSCDEETAWTRYQIDVSNNNVPEKGE